ncbi:MAG: CBS domain-containing protein [Deltaproteobacteria bacterium]|nr:CBS domain-containing protein [Deltaproteobacteria bacterium]
MRLPYFVPESMNVHKLLQEFRRRRIHMAVAIDEHGGTSGVVTLENLLELLVGEIQDEYDYEEQRIVELADGSYLVDARADIEALEETLGVTLPRGNFESAGGLLSFVTGRIPQAGEEVEMEGLRFTVVSADERRILKLRVRRLPSPPSEG